MQWQDERQGRKTEAQFLWSIAQVLLWQLERARQPASQPALLRHLIFCLSSFLLSQCVDPSISLSPPLLLYLSCHLSGNLSLQHFFSTLCILSFLLTLTCSFCTFFFSQPSQVHILCSLVLTLTAVWILLIVCVGGRGSHSLHPSGSAPDPAAF